MSMVFNIGSNINLKRPLVVSFKMLAYCMLKYPRRVHLLKQQLHIPMNIWTTNDDRTILFLLNTLNATNESLNRKYLCMSSNIKWIHRLQSIFCPKNQVSNEEFGKKWRSDYLTFHTKTISAISIFAEVIHDLSIHATLFAWNHASWKICERTAQLFIFKGALPPRDRVVFPGIFFTILSLWLV